MTRRTKALKPTGLSSYGHRDHRSKKGRKKRDSFYDYSTTKDHKNKISELEDQEADEQIRMYLK